MHGLGRILRQAMIYAKPWQRYVLTGAMIALDLALVALEQVKGLILVVFGGFMTFEVIRHRAVANRSDQPEPERDSD
jgi:hypothetical protein